MNYWTVILKIVRIMASCELANKAIYGIVVFHMRFFFCCCKKYVLKIQLFVYN